ncbi:FecR family protein [Calycomorphotria hydatis]|uniref:FecR protein n=1 Tax=Calycomorphotria hydatis TaxID=2528027 RepID=A0A517T8K4_9PLAN|nr:FecR family protein [Calycomorphotria hydatis]QDT64696.1 FecR protein [Calycomorphotria hydatis]
MNGDAQVRQELLTLADAMLDGREDAMVVSRLNELLSANVMYRQWYVEYIHVRDGIFARLERQSEEDCIRRLFADVEEKRSGLRFPTAMLIPAISTLSTVALLVMASLAIYLYQPPAPHAGKLVGLTADASWKGTEYRPGDLILERMTVHLAEGIATFRLNDGAIISLQGPTTIEATDSRETKLVSGLLHAIVPKEAAGYTVRTIDAEVVDLGTEFTVERDDDFGTRVVVKRGRVEARKITESGQGSIHDLSAGRAMEFQFGTGIAQELASIVDWDDQFEEFENARSGIQSVDGIVRTTPSFPADLRSGQMPTHNYIMLVRECSGILLEHDLTIRSSQGETRIDAGTVVDSFLVHFDPTYDFSASPIGSVTFPQPILGVISTLADLQLTDQMCGNGSSAFPLDTNRGLELDDTAEISADRRSLNLHFFRNDSVAIDQCRILIRHADSGRSQTHQTEKQ